MAPTLFRIMSKRVTSLENNPPSLYVVAVRGLGDRTIAMCISRGSKVSEKEFLRMIEIVNSLLLDPPGISSPLAVREIFGSQVVVIACNHRDTYEGTALMESAFRKFKEALSKGIY